MTDGPVVVLRPAGADDAVAVWSWRQDPRTRAASFSADDIDLDDHLAWFADVLVDGRRRLYVVEHADVPVGVVRFDDAGEGRWEISINLAPGARGVGLGAVAIDAGVARLVDDVGEVTRVTARVRLTNEASLRVFRRAGFVVASTDDEAVELTRPVPPRGPASAP